MDSRISFRLGDALRDRVRALALRRHTTAAKVLREAIETYVSQPQGPKPAKKRQVNRDSR